MDLPKECGICLEWFVPKGEPPCGHSFCPSCLRIHINNCVEEEVAESRFVCPAVGCNRQISKGEVIEYCGTETWRKRLLFERKKPKCNICSRDLSVSSDHPHLMFCDTISCVNNPESNVFCLYCNKEVRKTDSGYCTGSLYSFGYRLYYPCQGFNRIDYIGTRHSCADFEEQKLLQIGKKKNWKHCPNCRSRIEKNLGCHHMHCSNCLEHFCWTCMRPLSNHSVCLGKPKRSIPEITQQRIRDFGTSTSSFCALLWENILFPTIKVLSLPVILPIYFGVKKFREIKKRCKKIPNQPSNLHVLAVQNGVDVNIIPDNQNITTENSEAIPTSEEILMKYVNHPEVSRRGRWIEEGSTYVYFGANSVLFRIHARKSLGENSESTIPELQINIPLSTIYTYSENDNELVKILNASFHRSGFV